MVYRWILKWLAARRIVVGDTMADFNLGPGSSWKTAAVLKRLPNDLGRALSMPLLRRLLLCWGPLRVSGSSNRVAKYITRPIGGQGPPNAWRKAPLTKFSDIVARTSPPPTWREQRFSHPAKEYQPPFCLGIGQVGAVAHPHPVRDRGHGLAQQAIFGPAGRRVGDGGAGVGAGGCSGPASGAGAATCATRSGSRRGSQCITWPAAAGCRSVGRGA